MKFFSLPVLAKLFIAHIYPPIFQMLFYCIPYNTQSSLHRWSVSFSYNGSIEVSIFHSFALPDECSIPNYILTDTVGITIYHMNRNKSHPYKDKQTLSTISHPCNKIAYNNQDERVIKHPLIGNAIGMLFTHKQIQTTTQEILTFKIHFDR